MLETDIDDPSDAAVLAGNLLDALSKPFAIDGNEIYTGASIGIAFQGEQALDPETLLSHADVALYRAKAEGRRTFRFFTENMDLEVRSQVNLLAELRGAIAAQQFFLVYQPQYGIRSGELIGVEALIRWRHPDRGVILPAEFIPGAEKSGVIISLGRWALREACLQAKAWLNAGSAPPVIAVNVSAVQFKVPRELERDVALILAETGLPPERLELELTETAIMEAWRDHREVLTRIRDTGVRIAIDDFGTGYSSLDYLRRLPISLIKLAGSFVSRIATNPGEAVIVKAMIGLAHDLGLNLIAEEVETREQLDLLESWDCPNAQGFYFSPPLSSEDLSPLLKRGEIVRTMAH